MDLVRLDLGRITCNLHGPGTDKHNLTHVSSHSHHICLINTWKYKENHFMMEHIFSFHIIHESYNSMKTQLQDSISYHSLRMFFSGSQNGRHSDGQVPHNQREYS